MRYPATIAGLIGLVGIVVAAGLFIGDESRFSTIVGIVSIGVMALANNLRTDSAANTTTDVKHEVDQVVTNSANVTPIALEALTTILRRTEGKVDTVVGAVNGPASTERDAAGIERGEASTERTRVQDRDELEDAP